MNIMNAIALPLAAPCANVVKISIVAEQFSIDTLERAIDVLNEIEGGWTQGVDETTRIEGLVDELGLDVELLTSGRRVDDVVLARATATLRLISKAFRRDVAFGLIDHGLIDPTPVTDPDFIQSLSEG